MPNSASLVPSSSPLRGFWLLLGTGLVCVAGFLVLAAMGDTLLALAVLVVPFQVLVWAYCFRSNHRLLLFFCVLFPLTALELMPYLYLQLVFYAGNLGLLAFLFVSSRFMSEGASQSHLLSGERRPLQLLAVLILVAGVLAVVRGRAPVPKVMFRYSVLALEVLLVVWVFAVFPQSMRQVRTLIFVMAAGYVLVCLVLPAFAAGEGGGLGGKTLSGSFDAVNLNAFAAHVGVFSALLAGVMLDAKSTRARLLLGVAIIVLLAALAYTRSRGAWVGLGAAFVYYLARTRTLRLTLVAAVAIAALLSVDVLRSSLLSRVEATSAQDPSLMGRLLLWRWALRVAQDNWLLGVGMENFRFVKHLYEYPDFLDVHRVFNTHNLYLEFLADLGFGGLFGLLWLQIGSVVRLDRLVRREGRPNRGIGLGLNAGIIAFSVHGLMDSLTWQHGAFILFGIVVGLAMCVRRLQECQSGSVAEGVLHVDLVPPDPRSNPCAMR